MNDDELRRLMEQEATAAENAPDEDDSARLAPHAKISRPNQER